MRPNVEMRLDLASQESFRGFVDLYDANRAAPPEALGPLLVCYANVMSVVIPRLCAGRAGRRGVRTRRTGRWTTTPWRAQDVASARR